MTGAHAMLSAITRPPRAGVRFIRGSIARRRIARTLLGYSGLLMLAIIVLHLSQSPGIDALALGFAFPGAGFLTWTLADGSTSGLALMLCAGSLVLFFAALVLWLATGNVVLPGAVWIGSAL